MTKALNASDITKLLSRDCLSQPRILLIEDCMADTALIKHALNDYYPFTLIDHVETRKEACEHLKQCKYDIVLLDLNLPDTKDLSDIGEIKILSANTPLIIVTGTCNPTTINAARQYKANGIIGKSEILESPFHAVMRDAVNNVICV